MKNINIVNKTVAKKLGLELAVVEKVNKAYWKEIVHKLTTLDKEPVHIKKIGTISVSPYKTKSHIQKLISQIRLVKSSTKYKPETRKKYLDQYYTDLRKILVKRNQIAHEYTPRIPRLNTSSVQEQSAHS